MPAPALSAPGDVIDCYRLAISREVELSSFWGRYFALRDAQLDIPNGFAHHGLLQRLAPVLSVLIPLARPVWVFVGLPLLATAWATRWSFATGWGVRGTVPPSAYLHASNDRNMSFVPPSSGRPSTAITLPWWRGPSPGAWAESRVDLRALSSRSNLWRAAWSSICAGLRVWHSPARHSVLFTYSAPAWFWTYGALQNSALRSLWISNHVDRWSSLATSLPGVRATIVQHGDLGHRDVRTDARLVPRLTAPLQAVEQVFVTDIASIEDFVTAVTGLGPTFSRIEVGMRVVPWAGVAPSDGRVLMIGHPDAQSATGRLMRDVDARLGGAVRFAYRPHPTESRPVVLPFIAASRVEVTPTGETVPEVDVVVSYGSSVTGEIVAATGAYLVHWDPNDATSASATVDTVVAAVSGLRQSRAAAQA